MPPRIPLLLAAMGAAALLLYLPGIGGPYLADDIPNLVDNRHLLLDGFSWQSLEDAALSSPGSPFGRPLSMLSFALNYTVAGSMAPASTKLINLLLHLCTGFLVYLLAAALLPGLEVIGIGRPREPGTSRMALLAAGLWLLHPLFVSTVLYTVQRMSILSALFVLAGCLFYMQRRPRLGDAGGAVALMAGITVFTALAFLCKENGALLPGFLLLIEFTLWRFAFAPGLGARWRAGLLAMLAVPTVLIVIYLGYLYVERGDWPAPGYAFSIHERLLTQFRVLAQYAGWIGLVSTEPMGLYHDDFPLSTGLLQPPATAVALAFWLATAAAAAMLARRQQLIGFGVLWFLWGHLLESTVVPLALVFEHRNYLPGFGLILALACSLYGAMSRVRLPPALRTGIITLILLALPAFQLHERVRQWSDERAFILHSIQSHPGSALTLLSAAVFLDRHGDAPAALAALRQAQQNDPREAALVYAEMALHCEHHPQRLPDADLARRFRAATANSPRTVTARKQFVEMAKACVNAPAADEVLIGAYSQRRQDRNEDVALSALFGIGAVQLHRGNYAEALAAWNRVVEEFRDGESLRPLLEELRRNMPAQ